MERARLNSLIAEWKIPFTIVADVSTGKMEKIGDPASFEHQGLIKTLFYDADAMAALNGSVQETSYRTWNQGDVACVVCKPAYNALVGFFTKKLGPVEQFHWAARLCDQVNLTWK